MKKIYKINFSLIFFILFIFAIFFTFNYGKNKNIHKSVEAIEDNIYALSVAVSNLKYGLNDGYVLYRDVYSAFERGGLTKKQFYLDKLNYKFPNNLKNPEIANQALKESLSLALNEKNPSFKNELIYSGGDVGLADFFEIAFSIFGLQIQSIYYFFFLILLVSSFFYFFSLNTKIIYFSIPFSVLAMLNLLLFLMYQIDHVETHPFIKSTNFNFATITSFRSLPILAIIPFFNIVLLFFDNKKLNFFQIISFLFQSWVLIFCMSLRISSYWILFGFFFIILYQNIFRYYLSKWKCISNKNYVKNLKVYFYFGIIIIFLILLIKNLKTIYGIQYSIPVFKNYGLINSAVYENLRDGSWNLIRNFDLTNFLNFIFDKNFFEVYLLLVSKLYLNFIFIFLLILGIYLIWKKKIKEFFDKNLKIITLIKFSLTKSNYIIYTFFILFFLNSLFFNLKINSVFFSVNAMSHHPVYHNAFIGLSTHPEFYKKYGKKFSEGGFNNDPVMDPLSYNEAYRQIKKRMPKDFEFDFMKHFTTPFDGGFMPKLVDEGAKLGLIEFIINDPVFFIEAHFYKLINIFRLSNATITQNENFLRLFVFTIFLNFFILIVSLNKLGTLKTLESIKVLYLNSFFIFLLVMLPSLWAYPSVHTSSVIFILYYILLSISGYLFFWLTLKIFFLINNK